MEQVASGVAVKRKSPRTLVAALAVVFFLAAFAVAFYYLGGSEVVTDLLAMAGVSGSPAPEKTPAAAPAAAPAPSKPATSSPAAAATEGLPGGVDDAFAKRMYVEQLESQVNIGKLVANRVSKLEFGKVSSVTGGTEIATRVTFRDGTSADGTLGLAQKEPNWFFVFISGKRPGDTGGDADTVATDSDDVIEGHTQPALESRTVDDDVLRTIVDQQLKSQEIFKGIADGTYTNVAVDGVKKDFGTARLDVTFSGPRGGAVKGRVLCIQKRIDGSETWFVTSFSKV